jgi:hypothetical protein
MNVELEKLKPNPTRDFAVDPIDPEQVALLRQSIDDHGFWGGAVLRQKNGHFEIAAGHTRIEAAKLAGITHADLCVADITDEEMVFVYGTENATQRGNSTTATVGTVAAGLRVIARAILLGPDHLSRILDTSQHATQYARKSWETARGNLTSENGIGARLISEFLKRVPKVTEYIVKEQLNTLKASPHYKRIITEVTNQIEVERKEAIEELKRAERERKKAEAEAAKSKAEAEQREIEAKAARLKAESAEEKAKAKLAREEALKAEADAKLKEKRLAELDEELKKFDALRAVRAAKEQVADMEATFDFDGVAQHLDNEWQVKTFKKLALKHKDRLPFKAQAAWAKQLKQAAKEDGYDTLDSDYMVRKFSVGVSDAKLAERSFNNKEQAKLEAADVRAKFERLSDKFLEHMRAITSIGDDLSRIIQSHPTTSFPITRSLCSAIQEAQSVITKLNNKLQRYDIK